MNRLQVIKILEREGLGQQDIQEFFGQLSITDEVALRCMPSLIDYSMNALDVVDASANRTRAVHAAQEAYRYAQAFVNVKANRESKTFDNVGRLKSAQAALVELVRLHKLKELIDTGGASQAQIDDYNTNKPLAWTKAESFAS